MRSKKRNRSHKKSGNSSPVRISSIFNASLIRDTNPQGLQLDPKHPWRNENLGRLILSSLINWQDILVRGLQDQGFRRFRSSHMNLLRHIDLGGTRITEIAERSRLSKQAIGQLVDSCEAEKLVKTVPDPVDRRAKIVTFTKLGRDVIAAEVGVMKRIDADLTRLMGARGLAYLRHALRQLSDWKGPSRRRAKKAH